MLQMKYLIMLLLITSTSISHAKELSYIRDYSYKASDLDSKVSARNNTLKLIKAGVLEEIISYVHSNNRLEQSQSGNDFKSSFIQRTSSSSAGFLKARILEESWDGFEMKIKAEVKADPDAIRKELERTLALNSSPQPQYIQPAPARPPIQPAAAAAQPQAVSTQPYQVPPVMPVTNTTADYSGYLRTAQLTEVYSLLTPLKLTMTEYYMMNGEWPSSLEQIRLKPEDMTDGQYLDKVRLGNNGKIYAYLSKTFGKNKILSLAPRSIMGGMQTRWDCSTNIDTSGLMGLGTLKCSEDRNLRYN